MTHEREPLDHEHELLAHFRVHGSGEPSAELDARILAAASAAAREAQQAEAVSDKAGWAQRLHQWLFGSGRQRWSVAVAGLACLGIGVSLTWRTLEQTPEAFDAVPPSVAMSPAAPAPAPMEAKRAAESESVARMAVPQERMRSQAPSADIAEAPMASATAIAPMAELVIQSEPREALLRLLELRKANKHEEAQRLLEQLKADYPQLDIEAELEHLANEPSAE